MIENAGVLLNHILTHALIYALAHLALQLIEMVNKFGENPTNFILYMTDPSPDNFAVNENTNSLKMIDLENIIVVDKEELILSKCIIINYTLKEFKN